MDFGKPTSPLGRATRVLQVCLRKFHLIRTGWQTKNTKGGYIETVKQF